MTPILNDPQLVLVAFLAPRLGTQDIGSGLDDPREKLEEVNLLPGLTAASPRSAIVKILRDL